jgi:hypothetical protein
MKRPLISAFAAALALAAQAAQAAPPTAAPDTVILRTQTRPAVLVPNPLANDSDPDGTPVEFVNIVTPPQHGVVTFKDGQFTYDPGRLFPGEDTFTYRITSGGELATGEVTVRNPFLIGRGVYATGFPATNANNGNAGYAEFRLGYTGAFSARIAVAGQDFRFKGVFDDTGTFAGGIGGNTLTLTFPMDANPAKTINGTFAPLESSFSAPPMPYGTDLPSPREGRFTFLLPAGGAPASATTSGDGVKLPDGLGFATVRGVKNGRMSIIGRLGDGQRWSSSTYLAPPADGSLPVYAELLPFGSNIFGTITFGTQDSFTTLAGTLQWLRVADPRDDFFPKGFQIAVNVLGSSYQDPGPTAAVIAVANTAPNALFTVSSGDLRSPKVENATLGRRPIAGPYDVDIANSTRIRATMRVEPRSGYFSGRFRKVIPNRYRRFAGVFVQSENIGGGVFDVKDKVGRVDFVPNP